MDIYSKAKDDNVKDTLVFGAGGHARVVIDAIELQAEYRVAGIVDPDAPAGSELMGYPVLGPDSELVEIVRTTGVNSGIVAIGDNRLRRTVVESILSLCPDFSFITAIHPKATVARNVSIGYGALVMPGVIVNAASVVGDHVILNSQSVVEHDCRIGDFVHIAPGTILAGEVQVDDGALVGLGSRVLPGKSIGRSATVGAGGVVVCDVPKNETWFGAPAVRAK